MKSIEALMLINSFVFSSIVSFSRVDFIFLLPIGIILFYEKEYLFTIFKKLIFINLFIVLLVIFVFFQNQNEALILLIRTNLILLFNIALFHKSKGYDIVRGLDALNFPAKVVSVFYFSLSLIIYLLKDFKETKNTLKSRGFKSTTSIFTYQTYGNIFGMIFVKALRKSEDMTYSMQSRGFEDKIFFLSSNSIGLIQRLITLSIVVIFIKVIYELFS
ncbi:energy-coupling factor transporter transmembrane component T [Sulfurimonas sp.]|uniref:energy-coupling factor transporter transmembrane component T n=1 Tax=Sulfurimonas sp. TaxID=2022749 RepID=UPI0025DC1862|nr:energy-coupling factor transporter transmembrane component T [Sulfurimonas sp.]